MIDKNVPLNDIVASSFINEDIPIEVYQVGGKDVHVWRGDLMSRDLHWLPAWSKIAGIRNLLTKYVDKNKPLTHLAVDGSWSGWTLAALCEELGIEFHYSFPDSKKINRNIVYDTLEKYPSTKINPVKPNMLGVMYHSLKSFATKNEWQMLPYAFNHPYFVNYIKELIISAGGKTFDNLVAASGSGVVLSGLALGFWEDELNTFFQPNLTRRIWSTCQSSKSSVNKMLKSNGIHLAVNIQESPYTFDDRLDGYEAPFPCNQFWDIKQWKWLEENVQNLDGSILFVNLGGIYEY